MASSSDLVTALKRELKAAQVTYAELARRLGLAESSVKRMFSRGDMSLQRVDQICHALKLDFSDLAQRVVDSQPLLQSLSREQEQAVVTDPRLLLVAICVMSQWSLQQIVSTYEIDEAGCIA
ncbi:MAG: helix-turn-helix transcriptional regulator, partial [Betaproteobacteria bacterium]|nr:helix-turn-helix transcriptional regulator [Betaproteobacteria bacterium]